MKWTRTLVAAVCLAVLAGCGSGGGGGAADDEVAATHPAKEWHGQHQASIPDQPRGTLILGGE